jgi:hypothetical protein
MTSEAMSPLRRRIIEDMTVRKFVEKTQKDYIRYVKDLTAFLGRSPDTATAEDLRRYQLHLTNRGVHPPRINATVAALRFFFSVTLDRAEVSKLLTLVADPRKIPVVLSPAEVVRFFEAAPGPKYKAALSAAYGAGLRVSEVVALKGCLWLSPSMIRRSAIASRRAAACCRPRWITLNLLRGGAVKGALCRPRQCPINKVTHFVAVVSALKQPAPVKWVLDHQYGQKLFLRIDPEIRAVGTRPGKVTYRPRKWVVAQFLANQEAKSEAFAHFRRRSLILKQGDEIGVVLDARWQMV